jgi:hypothetical protein
LLPPSHPRTLAPSHTHRLSRYIPEDQVELFKILHQHMVHTVKVSAYNWIRPSLWASLFAKSAAASSNEVIGNKL